MTTNALPPPDWPLTDQSGKISVPWYNWLKELDESNRGLLDPSTSVLAVSSGGTGQATEAEAIGELTQALTENTTPDRVADYVGTYDASADTGLKVPLGKVTGYAVLASGSVSGTTALDLAIDYSGYKSYRLSFHRLKVNVDAVFLWARFSDDGGATFEADAADYSWLNSGGTDTSDSEIELMSGAGFGLGNASTEFAIADLIIHNPSAAVSTRITGQIFYHTTAGVHQAITAMGDMLTAGISTDVRFFLSDGSSFDASYSLIGII